MSKCTKVKNPCKICLGAVSQKTGLQCQGACKCWVHYSCLNYTPGKIKDIKAGIIKVTCPCPDCKTTLPREYRTDEAYSCNNSMCPANRPPHCDNTACPTNVKPASNQIPSCPLNKCGTDCKQYSTSHIPGPTAMQPPTPVSPCAPPLDMNPSPRCAAGCSSTNVSGDYRFNQREVGGGVCLQSMPSYHVVEQMCNTVGELSNQLKALMNQMRQAGVEDGRGRQPPKSCPKPCYCPGNPARRM